MFIGINIFFPNIILTFIYYSDFYIFLKLKLKMSIVKSSVLNLYDSLTGDKHYQQKVSSDRVDLQTTTLPLNLKGTSINLSNEGGQQVSDIVSTTLSIIQSVVDETNARVSAVSAEASTRASSDATLQTAIDNEVSNRIQAIIDESAIRLAAETVINNALTAEVAARQAAITSEITARSTADTNLQLTLTLRQPAEFPLTAPFRLI